MFNLGHGVRQRAAESTLPGLFGRQGLPILLVLAYGCSSAPAYLPAQPLEEAAHVSTAKVVLPVTLSTPSMPNNAPIQSADASSVPTAPVNAPATKGDPDSVYFSFGATRVDLEGQQKLRTHALRLKENPDLKVTLIGHTDHLGSRSYNLAIAEQRIETVGKLLTTYRVKKSQIRRYAVGSEKAERNCTTKACRQKIRRVELIFSP